MQPYFFPYIGYWQLINAVDKFVIYDDVNFKKKGWIHRNNILINGETRYFNIRLKKASQNKLINEIEILQDEKYKLDLLRTIKKAYKKAPYFYDVYKIIETVFSHEETKLSNFLAFSILEIIAYLEIDTEIILSSKIQKNNYLKGQAKIIEICKILGAKDYINPIGGTELYSKEEFKENGLNLFFINTNNIEYKQFNNNFIPNLSIIDVMMFNPPEKIKEMLNEYELK